MAGCVAALLFLYGPPVSHIARIRLDDIATHREQAHLMIQGHRTILPPVVDRLIHAAADAAQPRSTIGRVIPGTPWLIPGQRAGLPLAGSCLAARLRRHDFPILPGRNAARLKLAGETPAAAMSVTLGISLSGAVHWAKRANRDRNAFIQAPPTLRQLSGRMLHEMKRRDARWPRTTRRPVGWCAATRFLPPLPAPYGSVDLKVFPA